MAEQTNEKNKSSESLKNKELLPGLSSAVEGKDGAEKSLSSNQLKQSEDSVKNDSSRGLYNPNDRGGIITKIRSKSLGKRNRILLGAGGGLGIIGLIIFGFLALIPLKIESIIENLDNHFGATTQSALSNETENLVSSYLKGTARACHGTVITKDCHITYSGSPVGTLYHSWHDAKLETTLADKYGIEIQSRGQNYFLKAPGISGDGENITKMMSAGDGTDIFQVASKSDVRAAIDNALEDTTKWQGVFQRVKLRLFLKQKYGIKFCITSIGCSASDKITDALNKPKYAAENFIAERVLYPRSQMLGTLMKCFTSNPALCDPKNAEPLNCEDEATCGELDGETESYLDTQERSTLDTVLSNFVGDDAATFYADASENGLGTAVFKQVLGSAFGTETADAAADALPVVGWVNLTTNFIQIAQHAGPTVEKMHYAINAASMVSTYMLFRTYSDEIKSGHVDATEVGSFNDALGSGCHNGCSTTDPNEVGGTASAEASPLYQNLIEGDSSPSNTSGDSSKDLCNNNQPVPSGSLVCPEEKLTGDNSTLSAISAAFDGPLKPITDFADFFQGTIGKLFNAAGYLLSKIITLIPGFSSLEDAVSKVFTPLINFVINELVPNPFGTDMSGARTFDMVAGGADVSNNDYAHNGLGGELLTNQQVAVINNQQTQTAKEQFDQQPVFARIFSTTNQYSLVSKLALDMPSGSLVSTIQSTVATLLDPIGKITGDISLIFSGPKAFAATQPANDPFGVNQYGYPADSPIFNEDPDAYWQAHCVNNQETQAWDQQATVDSTAQGGSYGNETYVNTTEDPCLLIQTAVTSAGAEFSDSVLSPADQAAGP